MEMLAIVKTTIAVTAALVLILKTIHFNSKFRAKKFVYWFYFDTYNIVRSQAPESATAKRTQNILSVLVVILLFVLACYLCWIRNGNCPLPLLIVHITSNDHTKKRFVSYCCDRLIRDAK
jgi:hypothetical protein